MNRELHEVFSAEEMARIKRGRSLQSESMKPIENHIARKVALYNIDGSLAGRYDSINQCARSIGASPAKVSNSYHRGTIVYGEVGAYNVVAVG